MLRVADTKMQFVFKYLFCTVHLHVFHINVHKFNNKYVSSCELCKMGGMVELKGNVIGKHKCTHFKRSTVILQLHVLGLDGPSSWSAKLQYIKAHKIINV